MLFFQVLRFLFVNYVQRTKWSSSLACSKHSCLSPSLSLCVCDWQGRHVLAPPSASRRMLLARNFHDVIASSSVEDRGDSRLVVVNVYMYS